MINSYNTSAVYISGLCFLRALCEGCVPQRPTSHSVLFWTMKDIPWYEGLYAVTDDDRVWSYKHKWRFLKIRFSKKWYWFVGLCKDGVQKTYSIHQIKAIVYLPNPNNYKVVRHLDNNPFNNSISNLEWCTQSTNIKQAFNDWLCPLTNKKREARIKNWLALWKPVMQLTKKWILCNTYKSCNEAYRITGIRNISSCARWRSNYSHAGGFIWKYI